MSAPGDPALPEILEVWLGNLTQTSPLSQQPVLDLRPRAGTPNRLPALQPGTYYLAWQADGTRPVPSIAKGGVGSGWALAQDFGPFPAQIGGEVQTREV